MLALKELNATMNGKKGSVSCYSEIIQRSHSFSALSLRNW